MNKTIQLLVVDDDAVDRIQLKKALKSSGFDHRVTECEDPAGIGEIIRNNSFDCIFLDYMLPGRNGLELVRMIRQCGIKTPIVITTSHGNENIAVDLMKAGASDYVIKNEINGEYLRYIVMNALRIKKAEEEREIAEQALKVSEARLAEAQRIAKVGNWEYDSVTDTTYWSAEMYKIFNMDPVTFIPTVENYLAHIPQPGRNEIRALLRSASHGQSFNIDFQITTAGGLKFVNAQGYVRIDEPSGSRKFIGTLQDITERKLSEKEIQKAREIAEQSMKAREIFLANMSHEIRTPMNAILGFTKLLMDTELTSDQRQSLEAIHFSGENLLVIINDVLDLSKIQSGKLVIEKCEFNIQELMGGVVSMLKPKAIEKGLQLSIQIASTVPSEMKGDPVRLNQILTNLISNAIKFTAKGSVYLKATATLGAGNECMVEFTVKDTGIGIPTDKQEVIFESFTQGSGDTTRKYGGTGLGLAIVKSLVEMQRGTITVTSMEGEGSTFTVQLPMTKVDRVSAPVAETVNAPNGSFSALMGARILVAEDNDVNQLLIRRSLEKKGCEVDIAVNGVEVLERIKLTKYDMILMDVQMPEMDGYEATRLIRSGNDRNAEIPILAMTAHVFSSDVTRCMEVGMNDHVGKPFQPDDLYSRMCKYLNGRMKVVELLPSRNVSINLAPIFELSDGDEAFLNELIVTFDQQTPMFIERLRGYLKSQNFGAIKSICHQIKSSYGILQLKELDSTLVEISGLLNAPRPDENMTLISSSLNTIISLIAAITEDLKRTLRKTG